MLKNYQNFIQKSKKAYLLIKSKQILNIVFILKNLSKLKYLMLNLLNFVKIFLKNQQLKKIQI